MSERGGDPPIARGAGVNPLLLASRVVLLKLALPRGNAIPSYSLHSRCQ
jgi:hypothetical protein